MLDECIGESEGEKEEKHTRNQQEQTSKQANNKDEGRAEQNTTNEPDFSLGRILFSPSNVRGRRRLEPLSVSLLFEIFARAMGSVMTSTPSPHVWDGKLP